MLLVIFQVPTAASYDSLSANFLLLLGLNEAYFGGSGCAHSQLGGKVGEQKEKKKITPEFLWA